VLIKHIKKKVDRFLSITKNIHNFTSIQYINILDIYKNTSVFLTRQV
jgi:hypothetical protein